MDIKTLVLALALGNLSLCAALFFFEYESRKSLTISTWAVAKQAQAAAWFLLYFRGVLPDVLTGPLANVLLFAGMALDAGALWEAAGRPGWRRLLLPALAGASFVYLGCHVLDVEPGARAAAGFLIVSGFFLAGVGALALAWRSGTMLRRYLVVTMVALSVVVAGRGLLAALLPEGWSWVSAVMLQGVGFGALYLMMLTNAFGFLLLSREKLQSELARLEVVDALTDVPNRRGFYQALAPWMALARRPGMPTAMIILNLDQFKRVNDSYGHQVGDTVLRAMVDVCKKQLRDSDLMGRLGGAEFAIQLPRTSQADAAMVAERIRAAIEAMQVRAEKAIISLTASMGVTVIRADDSTVTLFKRVDGALQAAMLAGANRVVEAPDATFAEVEPL
ncbi:GGDEF domain-containing protein [Pseudoduganella namucuonensis]|uniref:diguanylate cyclase n=1 Tax=Pseudoduganella namucuonensis TaxID=1035707 RepID=A0A1I7LWX3_9BURK|nr:GGDEF domain-containing protein [Pseudoduganella namucuonensis]SFV14159.1 diguanylate cyclase [Pseudoduganella namucuonensis]